MKQYEAKWTAGFANLLGHDGVPQSLDGALTLQWRDECPSETFARLGRQFTEATIAEVIASSSAAREPLLSIFPQLASSEPLTRMDGLSTRSLNALTSRFGFQIFSDMAELSTLELLQAPGLGVGSVRNILRAILRSMLELPTVDVLFQDDKGSYITDVAVKRDSRIAKWQQVFIALAKISRDARGGDAPVLSEEIIDSSDPRVSKLIDQLFTLTNDDVLGEEQAQETLEISGPVPLQRLLIDRINELFDKLDERQIFIAASRIFAVTSPLTLDEIGARFHVTRERIRQLERRAISTISDFYSADVELRNLVDRVQESIDPLTHIDNLVSLDRVLLDTVEALGLPLFRIVQHLLPNASNEGEWFASPNVDGFRKRIVVEMDGLQDDYGVVDFDELAVAVNLDTEPSLLRSWLEYSSIRVQDGYVLSSYGSAPARIAAQLSILSRPATFDELFELCGEGNDERTFRNALHSDSRFSKVNKESFALAAWGGPSFVSIREQIRQELVQANHPLSLRRLVDHISKTFQVKPSSVKAYASSHPFKLNDGMVDFADAPISRPPDLGRSRGLFRVGNVWKAAYTVNSEHLRGSGFQAPAPLAVALGVGPGGRSVLHSALGEHGFYWTGLQPTFGSIRLLLERAGFSEGECIFVAVDVEAMRISIQKREVGGQGTVASICMLAGIPAIENGAQAMEALAEALMLDRDAPHSDVEAFLRKRGDVDLADLVVGLIASDLPSATPRSSTLIGRDRGTDGESILDIIYG